MSRGMALTVLAGFLVGVAAGCGASNPPTANGGGGDPRTAKPGVAPNPIANDDLPAKKARLADLEKAIAAKEKELADLRAEAGGLRQAVAAAEGSKDKVCRTPEELFADLPKDAYPKYGPEGAVERAATRKWCKANLPGRVVEWQATINTVRIQGDGPFTAELICDGQTVSGRTSNPADAGLTGLAFGGEHKLATETCQAILTGGVRPSAWDLDAGPPMFSYGGCTADEARQLRDLKGKKVTLRAKVVGAEVGDYVGTTESKVVPIAVEVDPPTVDGFYPEAWKKGSGK